jgi:nucleoside-diphosphate-sugar epimerase
MRVFVTGATGFIGSAVVKELIAGGHTVIGLARSDAAAKALTAAGAEPHRGTIDDPASLRQGAAKADGVIHLAYVHDLAHVSLSGRLKIFLGGLPTKIPERFGAVINETESRAIDALGSALAGSDRPLIVTAGIAFVSPGQVATEDTKAPLASAMPRGSEQTALALGSRGVRVSVVRLPLSVHGEGDHGFVPTLIGIARKKGTSATVDGGRNRWSAVHRLDAARLFRLVLEMGAKGAVYHGVAEEGVPFRDIAAVIGRRLGLPVVDKAGREASKQFSWFSMFAGVDAPATSAQTRAELGWAPTQPGLLADIDQPGYFKL